MKYTPCLHLHITKFETLYGANIAIIHTHKEKVPSLTTDSFEFNRYAIKFRTLRTNPACVIQQCKSGWTVTAAPVKALSAGQ